MIVWNNVVLTEKAQFELDKIAVYISVIQVVPDFRVPVLTNALSLSINGCQLSDFKSGYRAGFLNASLFSNEILIMTSEFKAIAFRPDEFMNESDAYTIDLVDGVYEVIPR
jgi:hypothetical protein